MLKCRYNREEQFGFPVKAFGRSALPLALPIENAKNINYLKNRLFSILFPVLKLNQTKKKQNRQLKKQTSKVRYSVKTGHPGYYTKNLQHKNSARPCERVAEINRYHCVLHQKNAGRRQHNKQSHVRRQKNCRYKSQATTVINKRRIINRNSVCTQIAAKPYQSSTQ